MSNSLPDGFGSPSPPLRRLLIVGGILVGVAAPAAFVAYRLQPPPRSSVPTATPKPLPAPVVAESLQDRWQKNPADAATAQEFATTLEAQGRTNEAISALMLSIQRAPAAAELYHTLGALYLRHDHYPEAVRAFQEELKRQPDSFSGHANCGIALVQLGRKSEAVPHFQKAQRLKPDDPQPLLGLAYAYNDSKHAPQALASLNEYIRRAPQPGEGYALQSRILLDTHQAAKAVEAGRNAVRTDPQNVNAWYTLGQALEQQGGAQNLAEAEKAFRSALAAAPDDADARFELGATLQKMGRDNDAITEYKACLQKNPRRAEAYARLGKLLALQGQKHEAAAVLAQGRARQAENARETDLLAQNARRPRDPEPAYQLGLLYEKQGRYASAQSAFRAVLEREPGSRRAHAGLARTYTLSGDAASAQKERQILGGAESAPAPSAPKTAAENFALGQTYLNQQREEAALPFLEKAARLEPRNASYRLLAGVCLMRSRRTALARQRLQEAVRLDPAQADAYLLLARSYDQRGTYAQAESWAQQYIAHAANAAPGHYLLAKIYSSEARLEAAETEIKRALALDGSNPVYLVLAGRMILDFGRSDRLPEAVHDFERALQSDPNQWEAHHQLGRALLQQDRPAEAVTHQEAALRLSPEPGPLHYDLALAYQRASRPADAARELARYRAYSAYIAQFNHLNREIDRQPGNPARRLQLARFCLDEAQPQAAAEVLNDAIIHLPAASADFYPLLAQAHQQAGRDDKAVEAYDALQKIHPHSRAAR